MHNHSSHHHHYCHLLCRFHLFSNTTTTAPSLPTQDHFLYALKKLQSSPLKALSFFNYAASNLSFALSPSLAVIEESHLSNSAHILLHRIQHLLFLLHPLIPHQMQPFFPLLRCFITNNNSDSTTTLCSCLLYILHRNPPYHPHLLPSQPLSSPSLPHPPLHMCSLLPPPSINLSHHRLLIPHLRSHPPQQRNQKSSIVHQFVNQLHSLPPLQQI